MEMNRRAFIGGACLAAAGVAQEASADYKANSVRGRTFVAACPNKIGTIPRTPGPMRVMIIGAHPDDADIGAGCLAIKLIEKGAQVKFVSVTVTGVVVGGVGYCEATYKKQTIGEFTVQ